MCLQAGVPLTLSSDAHEPGHVGAGYEQALQLLAQLGVGELCVFERRARRLVPIAGHAAAPAGGREPEGGAQPGGASPR
jgi:hypothetical protein